jgi:predicted DNA-binding WGR domain protein
MYYACLLYSAQETETKFYLLKGVGERQTERWGREGEASAANFQNKIAAQGYIPHH